MQTWKWLTDPDAPYNWRFIRNVLVKTAILFAALNVVLVLVDPLPALGRISAYNVLFRGRERLPYGENPAASYNLSLYQIDAMFAAHALDGADRAGEFRVLLVGDSSVWGILLEPDDTLAGQINRADLRTASGERVRAYNLGYPTMSLTKDLMLLDYAMRYDPDLVVWLVTLESFDRAAQLESAIVQNNAPRIRDLIARYNLDLDPDDPRLVDPSTWDKTLFGRRRALADLLRLQLYGVPWAVTGIDQEYPDDYTPRAVDLPADATWHGMDDATLTRDDLAFDVLEAGIARARESAPVLVINEPIFISEGENSDIRYNFFYPQWLYDLYRGLLVEFRDAGMWPYLDLWDLVPDVDCYTDSAVHLTPDCSARLAERVGTAIVQMADTGDVAE